MGTRSLTIFKDDEWEGKRKEICVMYRQMDGYPEGHGIDLAEFLSPFTIVNGISLAENRTIANGMGCLTAQVIAHFKQGVGGFYIHPAKTRNCGEDYRYIVYSNKDGEVMLRCEEVRSKAFLLYDGTAKSFINWVEKQRKED